MKLSKLLLKWSSHPQVNFSTVENGKCKQYIFDVPSIPNLVKDIVFDLYMVEGFFSDASSSVSIDHCKKCCTTITLFMS